MDAALVWTIVGSVGGVAGAAFAFVQLVQPGLDRRRAARATAPVRSRRWRRRWPARNPLIANPTPAKTPRFTGRADLLKKVRVSLSQPQPLVLYGLGGAGKTQLALAYLAGNQHRYQVMWWLRAEQTATLESDLVALGKALRLPEADQADQPQVLAGVRTWLARNHSWLLILDNARDESTLRHLGPVSEHGRVLVTSRNQLWRDANVIWVAPWSAKESVAFLRASLAGQPDLGFEPAIAAQIAAELGHLPIALEQAVAYLRAAKRTLADYLDLLRTRPGELFALSDLAADERTVAKTWAVALEEVASTQGAAELLAVCAYLAPDHIPRILLHLGAEILAEPLEKVAADEIALDQAVITLRRFSLVDVNDEMLGVHRLVQAVVRHRLGADGEQLWAASAVRLVHACFPRNADDVRTWDMCELMLGHGLIAAEHAQRLDLAPEFSSRLFNAIGLYLNGRARFGEARAAYERALEISETAYGPDHADVAADRSNLGSLLWDTGDLTAARAQFEQALAISESALGPDHPNVAITRSNLGLVLRDMGDLAAEPVKFCEAVQPGNS